MSTKQISTKKLKAIVFTDIVDFTKLSADDEQKALEVIDRQRDLLKPIVLEHKGEWLKEIGDGLLFSFDSSLDAVKCSIKIQETLKDVEDFKIRIGMHQGDIFIKDGDVYGDDVNIASRVEGFAPIGGISISDKVYNDISGVSNIQTTFLGHRKLKGVEQETKIRCIVSNDLPKHKSNFFIKVISYIALFLGVQLSLVFLLDLGLFIFRGGSLPDGYKFMPTDLEYVLARFKEAVLLLLIGYSCLSFMRGISIKSQKGFFYFIFLYLIYYIYDYLFIGFEGVKWNDPASVFGLIFVLILIFGIPLLLMVIFKYLFKRNEKRK